MSSEIRNSAEVTTSRICFIEETWDCFEGLENLTLADYCGLGHLRDALQDQISDMELIIECLNCYLVEYDEDKDAVYHALHSDDENAFKAELRVRILAHIPQKDG